MYNTTYSSRRKSKNIDTFKIRAGSLSITKIEEKPNYMTVLPTIVKSNYKIGSERKIVRSRVRKSVHI
jgi:hypothetical protein